MFLESIDENYQICHQIVLRCNFFSIDPKIMILMPFDASQQDNSDGGGFIILRSLDGEVLYFNEISEIFRNLKKLSKISSLRKKL